MTGSRLRLARLVATVSRRFLPLPAGPPFLARQESPGPPSSISFRPFRCAPFVPGLFDSHRGRDGRVPIH
ncbi:hypothetical protein GTK09_25210 [Jiella sp. 40Bstr34]|uniref:Uncharacterized protein n=1 Tax=Jiella pacifica TaxID=2696469 RepID=A0A6N9T8G0_9HYPH|nr:hypothetical protein [Jiella pacifica]